MDVLITGATSGIGRALALSYALDGHSVIAIGRNKDALNELSNNGIYTVQLDLVNLHEVQNQFKLLAQKFPSIDIAILNAGTCEYLDSKNFDAALVKRVVDANLISLANSIEGVLPLIRKSSTKHLVGVASMAGYLPLSRAEAYGASKAGADYLLETLAVDLKDENICVSVVNPGFVKTPLTAKNDFPMPFAVDVDTAVKYIKSGIEIRKAEIHFPYRLSFFIKLFGLLPRSWWRILAQKLKK